MADTEEKHPELLNKELKESEGNGQCSLVLLCSA